MTDVEHQVSWRRALLPSDATIHQAVRSLDSSGLQIIIVVDAGDTLVGTVTDGDIRRGLLRGLSLDSSIEHIVHREAFVVPPQWGRDIVLQLMTANRVHQLPIVDETRRVVGLHIWDLLQPSQSRQNTIVVMAGGKGTRLRPHTENCPKPMLPVNGKPMLEHIIERARYEGFEHFVFAINYLGYMIEEYFGDGSNWQVKIEYLREPAPLGTAGALSLLKGQISEPILVTNGDLVTDFRYAELLEFHGYYRPSATMAVRVYEWQNPFGVVKTKGVDIVGFEEKPISRSHINAGIYVLEPHVLDLIGADEYCDMPTLFARLQNKLERTIAFPVHEPWLDVGRPNDLELAQKRRVMPVTGEIS